jgi:hypothetical protein
MRAHELILEAASPKKEAADLVRKTKDVNLLTKILNYLNAKIMPQAPEKEEPAPPSATKTAEPTVTNPAVKESVESNVKAKVLAMLGELDDSSPEWEKIIGVLRKHELTALAAQTVQRKMGSVNNHLDKKLRDMVMRVKVPFEQKEAFLEKLARGDGFFDGKQMLTKTTGNVYDAVKGNAIASIVARQMAVEFRGDMGYGPSQGPGEIMMVLLGKNIALASKGDLQIGNKVAEIKATSKSKSKWSGGRLYSTTGYGANTMIKRELFSNLVAAGIPREVLAQYGMPKKEKNVNVIPGGLNINPSGLINLSNLFKEHGVDQEKVRLILNDLLNGFYTKLPEGMAKPILDLVQSDGTFDPNKFLVEMTKLAHKYYMMLEGHDALMLFNSENGNYAVMVTPEDVENLLSKGVIALASHLDLNDDRSKGSSQMIMK